MRLSAVCLVLATVAALPAQASSFVILPPAQSDSSPSIATMAPIPFSQETFAALKAAGAAALADPKSPAAAIAVAPSASMIVTAPLPLSPETRKAIQAADAASATNSADDPAEAPPIPVTPSASMVVLGDPALRIDPTATVASIGDARTRTTTPTIIRGGVVSTSASPPAIQVSAPAPTDSQVPEGSDQTISTEAATDTAAEAAPDASPAAAE